MSLKEIMFSVPFIYSFVLTLKVEGNYVRDLSIYSFFNMMSFIAAGYLAG